MSIINNTTRDTGSRFGQLLWVEYSYEWGNGYTLTLPPRKAQSFGQAQTECAALIPTIEAQVTEQAYLEAAEKLRNPVAGQVAQLVIPAFPDELPESDPSDSVSTRQREFHRWLVRWVWPKDLLEVTFYFLDVWTWMDQKTAPNIRTYLNVDNATYNSITQRMGNALTLDELWSADVPGDIA